MADKAKEGKKPHKNKPTSKKYSHYSVSGESVKRPRTCPRCGPGSILGDMGNRLYCGKCHYTEFKK